MHRFVSFVAQYLSNLGVFCIPSSMELWKIHHQTPHGIQVRTDQLLGLETELLIINEMVSDQDIYLHVGGVPTWVVQLYQLTSFHTRHKLDRPMCGYFESNIFCCDCKILHGSNTIIIHLEYIKFSLKVLQFIWT